MFFSRSQVQQAYEIGIVDSNAPLFTFHVPKFTRLSRESWQSIFCTHWRAWAHVMCPISRCAHWVSCPVLNPCGKQVPLGLLSSAASISEIWWTCRRRWNAPGKIFTGPAKMLVPRRARAEQLRGEKRRKQQPAPKSLFRKEHKEQGLLESHSASLWQC